jgi:hypothetical protein
VINNTCVIIQRDCVILSRNYVVLRAYSLRDVLLLPASRGEPLAGHDAVWLHQQEWIGELFNEWQ